MKRVEEPVTGEVYHVMNKSIAGYKIFHGKNDYERMLDIFRFFSFIDHPAKFSQFRNRHAVTKIGFAAYVAEIFENSKKSVQIISYCLMPTHIHLVIKQLEDNGIATFMGNVLNSYARYFNTKHKRSGSLWVGPFKNVHVVSDEQLLHLTRYVHLNPTSAGLVKNPKDWQFSSCQEFIKPDKVQYPLCSYKDLIGMSPADYKSFIEEYIDIQRELAILKHLILE